jgi:para-nitrobenzyl esterase
MSALWAGFAQNGAPSATDVPDWPAYTLTNRATMWIDSDCTVVNDPDQDERLCWQG